MNVESQSLLPQSALLTLLDPTDGRMDNSSLEKTIGPTTSRRWYLEVPEEYFQVSIQSSTKKSTNQQAPATCTKLPVFNPSFLNINRYSKTTRHSRTIFNTVEIETKKGEEGDSENKQCKVQI